MVLIPKNGNDNIMTPPSIAMKIVQHFRPHGKTLEPCKGDGAFISAMPDCDWYENTDFMSVKGHWDWIVTNPPWGKFRSFLIKSMEIADNIVFLSLINTWFMRARMRDMKQYGFGLIEILIIDPLPPKPWPQTGLALGAGWARRGWMGGIYFSS